MKHVIIAGVAGLAVAAGLAFWQTSPATTTDLPLGAVNAQENGDAAEVDISGITEMSLGNEDADVTVIEYASFTCPHCANFHKGPFKQLKSDYIDEGTVHFIYRDVYFDRFGLWASIVARCGGEDRFFGITDMLYEQQEDWIGDGDPNEIAGNLRRIGKVAGLEDDQLEACLSDNDKAKALVSWYQQNAETHEVDSTPTLIVNGEKHPNMAYDELAALIDDALDE